VNVYSYDRKRQFVGEGQYHYCMVYGPRGGGDDQMPSAASVWRPVV